MSTVMMRVGRDLSAVSRQRRRKEDEWTEAADFPPPCHRGCPEEVLFPRSRSRWLEDHGRKNESLDGSKSPVARWWPFAPQCTHLGLRVPTGGMRKAAAFSCPSPLVSGFPWTATCLSGPAPRSLDQYAVKIENGNEISPRCCQTTGVGAMRRLLDWLENRTGIETASPEVSSTRTFPRRARSWHQAFGSVAVFAFLLQVFTGILLAFNYAPTPGDAYNSLRYIVGELTRRRKVIRGLHSP